MIFGRRSGITALEVLLGLAICALAFAGIAFAVHAGTYATATNRDFYTATQAGRAATAYMGAAIRRSDPQVATVAEDTVTSFGLSTDAGVNRSQIHWESSDRCIYITRNGQSEVLARNVAAFQCRRQAHANAGVLHYSNYQITLSVQVGAQLITFSESTVARRAMEVR